MTVSNASQGRAGTLPPLLIRAQQAINQPEVQAMLRRLSEFGLGIFMPHRHDATTGQFQPLHDDEIQVESDLEVSFRPLQEITTQAYRFLPVGWIWRAGASTPAAACEMAFQEGADDGEPVIQHKMTKGS